jgi:2-iminobutanoate/2-iminopropanoate deaminase
MNQDNWLAGETGHCLVALCAGGLSPAEHAAPGGMPKARRSEMAPTVETSTPPGTPRPIGPYSHVAKVGPHIAIGGTAAFDPKTGGLAGADIAAQTKRILETFKIMLASAGSDLAHVVHVNVFLLRMRDFDAMNAAYIEVMGNHRPARTVIGVSELPKPGVLLTMNLTAVTRD